MTPDSDTTGYTGPAEFEPGEKRAEPALGQVGAPSPQMGDLPPKDDGPSTDSSRDNSVPPEEPTSIGAAELIERHQRGVWRYLRVLGCDPATADDLTQETFLRVLRRDSFVQHNDTATAGYLRRTAYNLLVSRHRKLGRMHTVAEPSVLDETWDRWTGKDLSGDVAVDALRECLQTLTGRARRALQMRFADEANRVDIGAALGITDHGARNLMQRAKRQLRTCVEDKLRQTDRT